MKKLILVIKILVAEQKVKFCTAICSICEKIEHYLLTHKKE